MASEGWAISPFPFAADGPDAILDCLWIRAIGTKLEASLRQVGFQAVFFNNAGIDSDPLG